MLDPYLLALKQIESSGNYGAVGPKTRKGNRAYGAYQVMDFNIPSWTQKHYGQQLTPEQFLKNTDAQDAVARGQFGGYVNKYGPDDAASMWFSGQPLKGNTAADITGTNVPEYVNRFRNAYAGEDYGALGPNDDSSYFGDLNTGAGRINTAFANFPNPKPDRQVISTTSAQPEARPMNGMGGGSGMGGNQGGFRGTLGLNRGLLMGLGADLLAHGLDTRNRFTGRNMMLGQLSDAQRGEKRAEAERAQQQANVTANYLESQGADPALVEYARQGMGAPAMSEWARINKRKGSDFGNYKVVGGRLVDLSAEGGPADVTPMGEGSGGFEGNSATVQGINYMLENGMISKSDAAQWMAGKTFVGPNGETMFMMPSNVFSKPQSETPSIAGADTEPESTSGPIEVTGAKENQQTRRARGFYDRMIASEKIFTDDPSLEATLAGGVEPRVRGKPGASLVLSDDYKKARSAAENWIRANLREESGAAIPPAEMQQEFENYFPMPNDPDPVIAQKREFRRIAEENMKRSGLVEDVEVPDRKTKIIQDAENAIARGADPDAVWQRVIETFKGM